MGTQVNRAEQLWKNWEDKQRKLESIQGVNMNDRETLKFKFDFLKKGMYRISVNPTEKEKLYLHVVKVVTEKLEQKLYPTFMQRIWHRINEQFAKQKYLRQFEKNKAENLGILKQELRSTGLDFFIEKLESSLDYEKSKVNIEIQSRLIENEGLRIATEMELDKFGTYQLNGFTLTHFNQQGEENTAFFSKESQINLAEATNLIHGRAVLKSYTDADGKTAKKWLQLDLGNKDPQIEIFPQNIEYDLRKLLIEHGAELDFYGFTKEAVQRSLEQGYLISFELENRKFFLQASPLNERLVFYDADRRSIGFSDLKRLVDGIRAEKSINVRKMVQPDRKQDKSLSTFQHGLGT